MCAGAFENLCLRGLRCGFGVMIFLGGTLHSPLVTQKAGSKALLIRGTMGAPKLTLGPSIWARGITSVGQPLNNSADSISSLILHMTHDISHDAKAHIHL